jgi:hypothetical protein
VILSIASGTSTEEALKKFFEGLEFEKLEKTSLQLEISRVTSEYSYHFFVKKLQQH